jgi:integrase
VAKGKADYIFQREGSGNWWIKLRSPEGRTERSLGTSDRRQAEIIALPMIAEHKARLFAARPRIERVWRHKLEPGREHVGEDGGRILATNKDLFYIDHTGAITKTEPNGGLVPQFFVGGVPVRSFTTRSQKAALSIFEAYRAGNPRPAAPAKKNGDDAMLETYLRHKNVHFRIEREARDTFALFKTLTDNKPIKDCTRDDGRKLVAHFEAQGLKRASIQKKVAWLNAACNFAIKEGTLRFNPFASIVPKVDDAERRVPLDDDDMKTCKRHLSTVAEADQLLFRLLATTGMRLGEAFQISSEATERGVRYVVVGTKTESSRRRVPLPSAVLPFLPKKIEGPLFTEGAPAASKRLNRFLRDWGVAAPGKVIHSLRHRAADRLRAAGAPVDVRYALLGHGARTVADSYGAGHPVRLLRQWIDKIGF